MMMGIPGIDFEPTWQRRNEIDFGGLSVAFISKEDLIIAKKISRRPQDLIDADLLEHSGQK
jgi:hypothetical protein